MVWLVVTTFAISMIGMGIVVYESVTAGEHPRKTS
jgi:hypothetical protein